MFAVLFVVGFIMLPIQETVGQLNTYVTPYLSDGSFTARGIQSVYALQTFWNNWPWLMMLSVVIIIIARSLRRDTDDTS